MNWHRVAFADLSPDYIAAMAAVTRMGLRHAAVIERSAGARLSIWTVDKTNAVTARAAGVRTEPVPDEVRDGMAYLYFAPGAMEAFREFLPPDWSYEACARPPIQLASLMLGDDADWSLFGSGDTNGTGH